MNRRQAIPHISFFVDDSGHGGLWADAVKPECMCTLVGWQCGFEPLFVAVYSSLPGTVVDEQTAIDLATDYLRERGWFGAREVLADYVLLPSHMV